MVAIADQQRVELVLGAVFGPDQPAAAVAPPRLRDDGLELDPIAEREAVCVLAQELVDLCVVREVGIALVHREVREADRLLGGVDVQRPVGGRASVGIAEVPVAADLVAGLEARVRDTPIAQRLAAHEAADAGPNHARARRHQRLVRSP